ncbi:28s ribosomal protein mitochondrial [Aix galericulata]|nr:28s ribosomal protein mitochondrial [Aix galericulata]
MDDRPKTTAPGMLRGTNLCHRYGACAAPSCLQYCLVPSRRQQRAGRFCGSCPPAVALLGQQGARGTATAQGPSAAPLPAFLGPTRGPSRWEGLYALWKRKPPAGGLGRSRPAHRDRGQGREGAMVQLGSRLLKGYRGGHVVIRLALGGCTNRPFYRIVAAHSRRARDGKYLEQLGCLDPLPNARGEKVAGLNLERLRHWLGCGAQLSRPAEKLLGLAGFLPLHPMTVTGAERLRRRQREQEAAVPTPGVGGSQQHGETA